MKNQNNLFSIWFLSNNQSYVLGGTFAALVGGREALASVESEDGEAMSMSGKSRSRLSADFFGSLCYTYQHGNFRNYYGDLTRLDARLDMCSASAFAKRFLNGFKASSSDKIDDPRALPRLNLIFQQQVIL